jgi:hypothetical protein
MESTDTTQHSASAGLVSSRTGWRRLLRFSLRGLLLLVLVVSVWLGWQVHRAHKQRRAIARIQELGGSVHFDYQIDPDPSSALVVDTRKQPWASQWLRDIVGDEYFRQIVAVNLTRTRVHDDDLWILGDLPYVEHLYIHETQITDAGLSQIARLVPQLKWLGLGKTLVTDDGLAALKELRRLENLHLWQTAIGDKGMKHLESLTTIRSLSLDRTLVGDAGLAHLAKMQDFDEWLGLVGTQITDDGLRHLAHLKKARNINLLKTPVSPKGGAWLSKQLPKCNVSY